MAIADGGCCYLMKNEKVNCILSIKASVKHITQKKGPQESEEETIDNL